MPHQMVIPVAVVVLKETKYSQPITINQELLVALKNAGIAHIALLPLCPLKVVSTSEAQFVPYPGRVMQEGLGAVQDELKLNKFTLVSDYLDIFKGSLDASESDELIIAALQKNIKDDNHNYRYVILDNLTVLSADENDFLSRTDLDATHTVKALRLRVACENYLHHLQQPKADADEELTKAKQKIVGNLLELAKMSTFESLNDFGQILKDNRATLETRRDSDTMIFLKVLLSFFTLGIAVACGLWEKEGEKVTAELSSTLSPSI